MDKNIFWLYGLSNLIVVFRDCQYRYLSLTLPHVGTRLEEGGKCC